MLPKLVIKIFPGYELTIQIRTVRVYCYFSQNVQSQWEHVQGHVHNITVMCTVGPYLTTIFHVK